MSGARSVLVTGASTGIGWATAELLAQRGWHVYAGYRKPADGERLAALTGVTPVRLDVTLSEEVAAVRERLAAEVGETGLDALVNNAGIAVPGPLELLPLARLRQQFEVNFFGQVALTQALLPLLRQARGRIVFVSSTNGRFAPPMIGAYAASKFALEGAADAWRRELRRWGIAVVLVEPGAIRTPIWERSEALGDQILAELDEVGRELYAPFIAAMRRQVEQVRRLAIPPERVARTIARALERRRPRARYLVGIDARFQVGLERLLPTRWWDAIVDRFFRHASV